MKNLNIIDDSFKKKKHSASCMLSVQAAFTGLSYLVYDFQASKCLALRHYDFGDNLSENQFYEKFDDIFSNDELINNQYEQVRFMTITKRGMLVPNQFYDVNHLKNFFVFNFFLSDSESLYVNKFNTGNIFCLFPLNSYFSSTLINRYDKVSFYHHSTPFIQYCLKKVINRHQVFINVFQNFFDILVVSPDGIELYNHYNYQTADDFIYYILNTYKVFGLSPEKSDITIYGEIFTDTPHYQKLKKFIHKIEFSKIDKRIVENKITKRIPDHTFLNLINMGFCE